jgi:putative acetyltransferase
MKIRTETPNDFTSINDLHLGAFPDPDEAGLVDQLRLDGDTIISLVALENEMVIGHVLFSRMVDPVSTLGLGPVAVKSEWREQRIAERLIRAGMEIAREGDWTDIIVLGDPAYYRRFGFRADAVEGLECIYSSPYLMALTLIETPLKTRATRIEYARAFANLE